MQKIPVLLFAFFTLAYSKSSEVTYCHTRTFKSEGSCDLAYREAITQSQQYIYSRMLPRKRDIALANRIAIAVHNTARTRDQDPKLLIAIMDVESRYQRWAKSSYGARGLMQVMPLWVYDPLCQGIDLWAIESNIECGSRVYHKYFNDFGKNMEVGLAAYNRGPVGVRKDLRVGKNPKNKYVQDVMNRYTNM